MAMRKQTGVGVRKWVLGAVASGLLSPSVPALAQARTPLVPLKKTAGAPVAAEKTAPPVLMAVPQEIPPEASQIQPASGVEIAANDKSEVQKQLELLYEKDGREMPDIKLNLQPIGSGPMGNQGNFTQNTGTTAPQETQTSTPTPKTSGYKKYPGPTPATAPPSNPQGTRSYGPTVTPVKPLASTNSPARSNPVTGFFKRLVPASLKPVPTTPPIPPDYANRLPGAPPVSSALPQKVAAGTPAKPSPYATNSANLAKPLSIPSRPTMQLATKPELSPVPVLNPQLSRQPQLSQSFEAPRSTTGFPPPTLPLPPLAHDPLPLSASPIIAGLPLLKTAPDSPPLLAEASNHPPTIVIPPPSDGNDFPNPFPELAETQADQKQDASPLDDSLGELAESSSPSAEVTASPEEDLAALIPDPLDLEDPFAVRVKDFAEPAIDESLAENTESPAGNTTSVEPKLSPIEDPAAPIALLGPPLVDSEPTAGQIPPAPPMPELSGTLLDVGALRTVEEPTDTHLEKMRRIRERFGMKGLKGFCPVTLRDERELFDAKPEFFATYRGQKFHFASVDSRNQFESDPALYAPAAYGADVVALGRDKDVVEGTLDFAAWFKGRLYLFGSQANYETFVKSPALYASPAGVE
ncbi:MAG: hypothetical protein DWI02_00410 [Planctomycetota bacterium]|nr:MAG: hypothetical protein DWI02_00410 [Planctomycetota bacterium]